MDLTKEEKDRAKLVEERKIRKKLKKEREKLEKAVARERIALSNLQPRDQHLSIISEIVLKSQVAPQISPCTCNKIIDAATLSNEFPTLGGPHTSHVAAVHSNTCPQSQVTTISLHSPTKLKKSQQTISLNLLEVLQSAAKNVNAKNSVNPQQRNKIHTPISANFLDSDNPIRKKGKHREVPKKKIPSNLKREINLERENNPELFQPCAGQIAIRDYCDNYITQELDTAVERMLKDIVYFQTRLFKQDKEKAFSKRRYILGFHEVEKFTHARKLKLIVIAPNLQPLETLTRKVEQIKELAHLHNIPYVFSLNRRRIGRLVQSKVPVSCVGVLSYAGAEMYFHEIKEHMTSARCKYDEENLASQVDETDPNIRLVNTLTENIQL